MTEFKLQLLLLKGYISELPEEEQQVIKESTQKIHELMKVMNPEKNEHIAMGISIGSLEYIEEMAEFFGSQ